MARNKRRLSSAIRVMITSTKAAPEHLRARLELRRSGAAGVHQDQNRRKNAKALRRDKSYRDDR